MATYWKDLTPEEKKQVLSDLKEGEDLKDLIAWDYEWYHSNPEEFNDFLLDLQKKSTS